MMYILGICFIIFPLAGLFDSLMIRINGIKVEATVIGTEKKMGSEGNSYFPVFQYKVGEKQFQKRYNTGYPRPKYSEGDIVVIYCHKGNPEKILVQDDTLRFIVCIVFIAIGIFLILRATFGVPSSE